MRLIGKIYWNFYTWLKNNREEISDENLNHTYNLYYIDVIILINKYAVTK